MFPYPVVEVNKQLLKYWKTIFQIVIFYSYFYKNERQFLFFYLGSLLVKGRSVLLGLLFSNHLYMRDYDGILLKLALKVL